MRMPKRKSARVAPPRKKSCQPCADAKIRCDQKRPCCSRCEQRDLECGYAADDLASLRAQPNIRSIHLQGGSLEDTQGTASLPLAFKDQDLDLACTIDPDAIGTRWLKRYMPDDIQQPKAYPDRIIIFISKVLQGYVSNTALTGTLPPFVHYCQTASSSITQPLTACLALTRLYNPLQKQQAAGLTLDTLRREMDRLYIEHQDYGEAELLAAFQASLIYTLLIYFHFDGNRDNGLHQTMVSLQDIACQVAKGGLVTTRELHRLRPTWESWIVAEAKRRTMYTMYLFDSILCARDDLPTFLGTELRSMPAPNGKSLWRATDRKVWELAYNEHLYVWKNEGQLQIEELWPRPPEMIAEEIQARQERVARWASALDEFGTMLYAVTTVTHGE